jgi:hypothetical protein
LWCADWRRVGEQDGRWLIEVLVVPPSSRRVAQHRGRSRAVPRAPEGERQPSPAAKVAGRFTRQDHQPAAGGRQHRTAAEEAGATGERWPGLRQQKGSKVRPPRAHCSWPTRLQ